MRLGRWLDAAAVVLLLVACRPRSEPDPGPSRSSAAPEHSTEPPAPPPAPDDPAHVAGRWSYRTESNCGPVAGVGELLFRWDAADGRYDERGCVYWAHSHETIYWWGPQRYDAAGRSLAGRNRNSLGDEVDGHWQLEGDGPERLVVSWNQTNGCHGRGVATRASRADLVRGVITAPSAAPGAAPCSADKAGPELWPRGK
jgi:hypothetical protein